MLAASAQALVHAKVHVDSQALVIADLFHAFPVPFPYGRGKEFGQKCSLFVGNRDDDQHHLSLTAQAVTGRSVVP